MKSKVSLFCLTQKKNIWGMLVTKQLHLTNDLHSIFFYTVEVDGYRYCLLPTLFKMSSFAHTGLERHDVE